MEGYKPKPIKTGRDDSEILEMMKKAILEQEDLFTRSAMGLYVPGKDRFSTAASTQQEPLTKEKLLQAMQIVKDALPPDPHRQMRQALSTFPPLRPFHSFVNPTEHKVDEWRFQYRLAWYYKAFVDACPNPILYYPEVTALLPMPKEYNLLTVRICLFAFVILALLVMLAAS